MKAAVCRFKVEFTSLIKKIKWVAVLKYKLEVFTLHCILSCYTPEATRRGLRLIYVARLFSFEIGSSIFMEWFFYTTLQRVITSTAFYTAVPLLSIFSCLKALFDFVVHADRRLFFHYVLISPVMERWADSLVPLWTSVLKLKPAPGWINRSCTFGFDGAPRVAHLTVVGLGSAGFQCYFDL